MSNWRKILYILLLCCIFSTQQPSNAFLFHKKDYKQIFIDNALNADKRNNINSAFFSFERAMYYYGKDKKVIETYANFCERHKYFQKAGELYSKLYVLTKDHKYLFKKNLSIIKTGSLSHAELIKLTNDKSLTSTQKIELNKALIYHFTYEQDWKSTNHTCKKIPTNKIDKDTIISCIVASQKITDSKYLLNLYIRFSDLNPKDSEIVNRILVIAEKTNNYKLQEKYIKKLIAQNPKDFGIKYRLAGFYQNHKQWRKSADVYQKLIASGDKSEHVKSSLAYVNSQLYPAKTTFDKKNVIYQPAPLTGYQLQEKLFYDALNKKNYKPALSHLDKMLKYEPSNTKLLKHKVDIYFATENYKGAIENFEKIKKIKALDKDESLFLAYLYSKINNFDKTFKIIGNLLKSTPDNEELLTLATGYSMETKDWDKAIFYNLKLLKITPKAQNPLKIMADLYSIKKDFPSAIKYYKILTEFYPNDEYTITLTNLYMANNEFAKAEATIEPLYNEYGSKEPKIVDTYLNTLLAGQKLAAAYWVVKNNHLEHTQNGYMVLGDMAMKDKDYKTASFDYQNALAFEPENTVLQNKLADSYRTQGYKFGPEQLYKKVLKQNPQNNEAKLGLGAIKTEEKEFKEARNIFYSILKDNPDYRPAKIAIANSYIANGDKLSALTVLDSMSDDEESKLMKASAYYDMNMPEDAKSSIKGAISKDADELRYKIKRDNAFKITPTYTFFHQNLADQYNLNYHKFGLDLSQNVANNANVFLDYNVIVYSSGSKYYYNNVVNEFRGGISGRPQRDLEYRADVGVKAYEFGGAMLNTDSWIKHYFNDNFTLKLGFKRDNIEQSYLSAVGSVINGVLTGRSAYNKVYLEYEGKLPFQIYTYGFGAYGLVTSANLNNNQYFEALVGAGKFLYYNTKNKWINSCSLDIVSYNMGYQYNQLNIPVAGIGNLGGYYSPSYFNATTGNLKIEGNIEKWHLKYGIKCFGGSQSAMSPDRISLAWGWSPYVSYDINDHIAINASYNHFVYADLTREVFMINAVIRGFKKHAKS